MKSSVATKDEEIANAATATEEAKAAVESAQQELAAANDKITALEAQLEEAKNVCLFFIILIIYALMRQTWSGKSVRFLTKLVVIPCIVDFLLTPTLKSVHICTDDVI